MLYGVDYENTTFDERVEIAKERAFKVHNGIDDYLETNLNNFENIDFNTIIKKGFYEDTEIGNWLNDNSYLKYDSNVAKGIESVTNAVYSTKATIYMSIYEGVYSFAESIVDAGAIVGTGVVSIGTGLYDAGQAIYGLATGNEWESVTKNMWNGTKGYVALNVSSMIFEQEEGDHLYDTLGEKAYNIIHSIGKGLGKTAAVIGSTILTFGTAAPATLATTAGVSGFGDGTQNSWADGANILEGLGAGTLNGLWESFQWFVGGKIGGANPVKNIGNESITKIFNSGIRVLLDTVDGGAEGFVQPVISLIYKDGYYDDKGNYIEFTENENFIDRYKKIFENNGGWTSVWTNAAVGGAMSLLGEVFDLGKYFTKSKNNEAELDTGAVKNIDKVEEFIINENALPNDVNQFANDYLSKMNKDEIKGLFWYENALGGKIEAFSPAYENAIKNGMNITKKGNSTYFEIKNILINKYNMSPNEASKFIDNFVKKKLNISNVEIKNTNTINSNLKTDEAFRIFSKGNGKYGVDQGVLKDFFYYKTTDGRIIKAGDKVGYNDALSKGIISGKVGNNTYFSIKNMLADKYNMSMQDASKLISVLDGGGYGACSYANFANIIVNDFRNTPELFEELFGFPLYKQTSNGLIVINDAELLLDLYVFMNHTNNGGSLVSTDINGNYIINYEAVVTDKYNSTKWSENKKQQYVSDGSGLNNKLINKYIQSKSKNHIYLTENIKVQGKDINQIKNTVNELMTSGKNVSLGIYKTDKNIRFIDTNTKQVYYSTFNWNEGAGHAVFVTGVTDEGFIVSSWGKELLIPFSDLNNNNSGFKIRTAELTNLN